ncbi:GNAT family N-acetyltransferase [Oceanomicrobium pacificus]|uniref:GNAT family N-acetyltransferase n=1 Tax=Oceanomicrobium pacificus TaxID=2692916 RepID=A0A6B0TTF0_9RHOB|nr:GNAT family N-acetyltransferase [Oceanomicrobium pacificus]MXU64253.1 GNAT family N-acetyltransferase [Oceanomicrobium pacificus]
MPDTAVRAARSDDVAALQALLETVDLFPPEMLPDMIAPALAGADEEVWLVAEGTVSLTGLCFARAEEMTDGTWNMLALGVGGSAQGQGVGRALVAAMEAELAERGARLLIVDTSGTAAFDPARRFYAQAGYTEAARIRDFWAEGDDKVTFLKPLGAGVPGQAHRP